jgi:hypothetical protein
MASQDIKSRREIGLGQPTKGRVNTSELAEGSACAPAGELGRASFARNLSPSGLMGTHRYCLGWSYGETERSDS